MTALTVLYARHTGLPLATLTTIIPGDPPSLDPSATLRLSPPMAAAQPLSPNPLKPPSELHPWPLTLQAADLAIATVEAEFDDPVDVFEWQVVTTTTPDGAQHHHR